MAMVRAAEVVGVAANLLYTWMYLKGMVPEAYLGAALGSVALMWTCSKRGLLAESSLHLFYLFMAGYGAWVATSWTPWGSVSWVWHVGSIALGCLAWGALVPVLKARGSSLPVVDGFTTVFSILATWWMIQFDALNWWYWLVIDLVSVWLYAKRGMPWGALLFAVYSLMALDGCFEAIEWF